MNWKELSPKIQEFINELKDSSDAVDYLHSRGLCPEDMPMAFERESFLLGFLAAETLNKIKAAPVTDCQRGHHPKVEVIAEEDLPPFLRALVEIILGDHDEEIGIHGPKL